MQSILQPEWFQEFLKLKATDHSFELEGATIAYRRWLNPGKPGLLLVHGHAAHSHWWDFIAPAFIVSHDVVAIDLSGSGDSDHRDEYSAEMFAREITTCLEAANLESPVVVGHSFGGSMTRIAAHLFPMSLKAVVLVDSAIPTRRGNRTPPPMPRTRTRFYPSVEEGIRRFRLRPAQPCQNSFIIEHIARHSLKATDQGYQFKLDPAVFAKMPADDTLPVASEMIRSLETPLGLIYGENSKFFPAEVLQFLTGVIDPDLMLGVAEAHHHVFLDQPLAFIDTLKTMLRRLDHG